MKCKIKTCRKEFVRKSLMHKLCGSPECAVEWARLEREKKDRAAQRVKRQQYAEGKKRIKGRSDWLREAQAAVNKFRRLQDLSDGYGCISCGTHQGKMNGGHYRSVGASPETRFLPENINLQCERCNSHLSGNIINYRIGLIDRYGIGRVEFLEGPHEAKHYSIEDIEKIKLHYSKLAKEIERAE